MIELIDGVTGQLLSKALDRSTLEHKLIANNIANSNTINFQPTTTAFSQALETVQGLVAQQSSPEELKSAIESWHPDQEVAVDPDYTSVQLDREMVKLTQNTLHYQALMTAKSGLSDLLRSAIKEGRS